MIKTQVLPFSSIPARSNIAVFVHEKSKKAASPVPLGSAFERALEEAFEDGFKGQPGQIAVVHPRNKKVARFLIVGMGPETDASLEAVRKASATAAKKANALGVKTLFLRPSLAGSPVLTAQAAVEGVVLGTYQYKKYQANTEQRPKLETIALVAKDKTEIKALKEGAETGSIFANATNFARDLVNQGPSDATPEALVKVARGIAGGTVKLRVFGKKDLQRMGMGAILGVNRGSAKDPYFLHLTYKPSGRAKRRIAFCGKGITFDSGGLSLKPPKSMETMKYDMSGAAIVISLFKALKELKPQVEVHGLTPLTENLPGPDAVKPGDVLKTMRGRTIEVLNTDAEGRLVLADALTYACRQPVDEIIDVATLTGACVIALGSGIAAILGTDSPLVERIKKASALSGEKLWELPLEKEYEPLLKSNIADIKNIGPAGEAGTIFGALFLKSFVDSDKPWAHLDIASTGWVNSPTVLSDAGSTGVMVRTFLHHILSYN